MLWYNEKLEGNKGNMHKHKAKSTKCPALLCQGLTGVGCHAENAWTILSFQPASNQLPSSPMP